MTGIDRTTIYRLLDTLCRKVYVTVHESDRTFGLALAVKQLGDGFTDLDRVCSAVAPEMGRLFSDVTWPSDYASHDRGTMMIRETAKPKKTKTTSAQQRKNAWEKTDVNKKQMMGSPLGTNVHSVHSATAFCDYLSLR